MTQSVAQAAGGNRYPGAGCRGPPQAVAETPRRHPVPHCSPASGGQKRIGKARFRCRSGPAAGREVRMWPRSGREECRSTTRPCTSVAPVPPVPSCVSVSRGQKRTGKSRFGCRSDPAASGRCRTDPAADGRCRSDPAPDGGCRSDPAADGGCGSGPAASGECPAGHSASSHRRATAAVRVSECWSVRPEASARRQRMPHRPRHPRCRRRAGRRPGAPRRRSPDGSSSAAGGSWRLPARRRSR